MVMETGVCCAAYVGVAFLKICFRSFLLLYRASEGFFHAGM